MQKTAFQAEGTSVVGPYSQAVEVDGWVYLSGQTPMNFETGKLVTGSVAEQTAQVFANLGRVIEAAGLGWENVVKTTVFLTDMADFQEMNATYKTFFQAPYPARSTIAVAALPVGARMEIELVARR